MWANLRHHAVMAIGQTIVEMQLFSTFMTAAVRHL